LTRQRPLVDDLFACVVAGVWLVHGAWNKLLGGSPRHLAIVQSVPLFAGPIGERVLSVVGALEVFIAVWVVSGFAPRLCAATQTIALVSMNVVELTFARAFLLWPAGLIPTNVAFLSLAWVAALSNKRRSFAVWLRRHPIAIDAHLRDCVTLTYAVPADVLERLLPPGLELETRGGYGFLAVALVQTEALRPAGFPRRLGQDFFLSGYRVFVRFRTPAGRSIRGLRILRSDANRWRMVLGGNLLTHYNYHRCSGVIESSMDRIRVSVDTRDGAGNLALEADPTSAALPVDSPFSSWREARYFAGPLPFTFDYEEETHAIVAIEARRRNWKPVPVTVNVHRIAFFDRPCFNGCTPILAAAFHVRNIDYRWERGVRHALTPGTRSTVRPAGTPNEVIA
jgi:uncharacterized membrane protein YphA (DoxX/SURF4 family)/uncharacterized protein YqjF (DUF2071 family)